MRMLLYVFLIFLVILGALLLDFAYGLLFNVRTETENAIGYSFPDFGDPRAVAVTAFTIVVLGLLLLIFLKFATGLKYREPPSTGGGVVVV